MVTETDSSFALMTIAIALQLINIIAARSLVLFLLLSRFLSWILDLMFVSSVNFCKILISDLEIYDSLFESERIMHLNEIDVDTWLDPIAAHNYLMSSQIVHDSYIMHRVFEENKTLSVTPEK